MTSNLLNLTWIQNSKIKLNFTFWSYNSDQSSLMLANDMQIGFRSCMTACLDQVVVNRQQPPFLPKRDIKCTMWDKLIKAIKLFLSGNLHLHLSLLTKTCQQIISTIIIWWLLQKYHLINLISHAWLIYNNKCTTWTCNKQ